MVDGLNFKAYRAKIDAAFKRRAPTHETIDRYYRAGVPVTTAIADIRAHTRAHTRGKRREQSIDAWYDALDHDHSMDY